MSVGPVDLVVLGFPGNQFKGEILAAIQAAVDAGSIRVVDILLAIRIGDEPVRVLEINEIEDDLLQRFEPVIRDATPLLNEQDAFALSEGLAPDSSVALLVFENTWAAPIADAIDRAGGRLLMNERIPRSVIEELVAEAQAQA